MEQLSGPPRTLLQSSYLFINLGKIYTYIFSFYLELYSTHSILNYCHRLFFKLCLIIYLI
jgi:hypothetical protein